MKTKQGNEFENASYLKIKKYGTYLPEYHMG